MQSAAKRIALCPPGDWLKPRHGDAARLWPPLWRIVRTALLCVACCTLGLGLAAAGEGGATVEQRVKAASLYKFLGYVEWPPSSFASPQEPYVIGVAGADGIADELERIAAGRSVNNRALVVRRLKPGEPLAGIHVLFIGRDERARQAQLLQSIRQQPILSVTETEGALEQGSMVNFRLVDDRVRFEVALDTVERAGLRMSSRMLSVAIVVSRGERQ